MGSLPKARIRRVDEFAPVPRPRTIRAIDYSNPTMTEEQMRAWYAYQALEAGENFFAFRRFVDKELLLGWWIKEVSEQLELFFKKLEWGDRPKLLLEAPPQHGKSRGITDFIAWVAGKAPHLRTMYGSYSEDLGQRANRMLQRMFDDRQLYGAVFPNTFLNSTNVVSMANRPVRNSEFLEYVGHKGSFANVTVQGQVTGKSLDFGVLDDPIKGRDEAQSKRIRDKTWNWLTDDFFSRFSNDAGLIMTMTRWHLDDPGGRFLQMFPEAVVLRYPAEALPIEERRVIQKQPLVENSARDPREPGDLLFPEFKDRRFINERKKLYTRASWESLYQQNPIISGGGDFPMTKVQVITNRPAPGDCIRTVRYWDKAGTEDGGAFTAGLRMHLLQDGRVVISDIRRGQWGALEREKMILACAEVDEAQYPFTEIHIEQEPGSGGKESAERTINMLRGKAAYADKVGQSKEARAQPLAAYWQAGQVLIVDSTRYLTDFLDELETFPSGTYKDQVDAAAGAFIKLTVDKYQYDSTMAWAS